MRTARSLCLVLAALSVAAPARTHDLQRDRARADTGAMVPLRASFGAILYAAAGVRAGYGPFTVGLGVKRAALKRLNEQADQLGSEGLEQLRAAVTLGCSTRL